MKPASKARSFIVRLIPVGYWCSIRFAALKDSASWAYYLIDLKCVLNILCVPITQDCVFENL